MPWKKRVSETGKGNRKNIILTMKNLRMQRWILNRRDDVMMLYGKQPVIQRIRILWNRRTLRRMRTMASTRKGMTWMTSTRGTGSASGSGHG